MSNEDATIYDFDFTLVCEYFSNLERQGPGSPAVTKRALGFIDGLTDRSRIADIGCGTGGQTMILAQNAPGAITAIDLFPYFIDLFSANAARLGLQNRVQGTVASMDSLPFEEQSLDLIWSEGAIYNIGFERGIKEWRKFLKTGGYIAVTENTWFTDDRPDEIADFWNNAYPEIDTIPHKMQQMQDAGYMPVALFTLPEQCWTDNFYQLQTAVQEAFLSKYPGNRTVEELIAYQRHEAQLYARYKQYYGYAFYIGKKI